MASYDPGAGKISTRSREGDRRPAPRKFSQYSNVEREEGEGQRARGRASDYSQHPSAARALMDFSHMEPAHKPYFQTLKRGHPGRITGGGGSPITRHYKRRPRGPDHGRGQKTCGHAYQQRQRSRKHDNRDEARQAQYNTSPGQKVRPN